MKKVSPTDLKQTYSNKGGVNDGKKIGKALFNEIGSWKSQ